MPTATHKRDIEIASGAMEALTRDLKALIEGDLKHLKADLEAAGAPWTPGR
jgi:enamine deaminase RidA (YjgF/YER057c/UK114 family)